MELDIESDVGVISSKLPLQARCLLLGITVPLFVVVLFLGFTQFLKERDQLLVSLAKATESQAMMLGTVADAAVTHVNQMRDWSEGYLNTPPSATSHWRVAFSARESNGRFDGFTLDGLPKAQRERTGQVVGLSDDPRHPRVVPDTLDLALELMSVARLAHKHSQNFQWSYFFSTKPQFAVVYPWVRSDVFVEQQGHKSMLEGIPQWFDYEIFRAGEPSSNPQRQLYWTTPYIDAGGAGAMVSLGAPVYHKGNFQGVVGTDVRLTRLQELVSSLPRSAGRLLLVSDRGHILADSDSSRLITRKLGQETLPTPMVALAQRAFLHAGTFQAGEGAQALARPIESTSWKLLILIDDAEVYAALWPHLVPYLVILFILVFNFFVALLLLQKLLINPALDLANLISRVSFDAPISPPALSYHWQPLAAKVVNTLEQLRGALARLKLSEAFKSAIVDRSMLPIISTNAGGEIVEFNAAAEQTFGFSKAQAQMMHLSALVEFPASVELGALAGYAAYMERRGRTCELRGMHAGGSQILLEVAASVASVEGQDYLTVFAKDVTADRRAQEELGMQREALRRSERLSAMGSLLAGVAHELNNPLAILLGRAELLLQKSLAHEGRADIEKLHAAAERCARVVRSFLAMARQRPALRRPVCLRTLILEVVDLIGGMAVKSGIGVDVDVPPDLPQPSVDADQISQVLVNLLVNAHHALCEVDGERRILVSARADVDCVVIGVADNGPGIPPDLREKIFDPYFTTKPEGVGTGVGLYVSQTIVREHGGSLVLRAPSTQGATFEMRLPVSELQEAPAAPASPKTSTASPGDRHGVALVIEDEPEVARLICDILNNVGFQTLWKMSGSAALDWIERGNAFSFIVCDVHMPDMDGRRFWQDLSTRFPTCANRVGFITGDTFSDVASGFLSSTGRPYLEKPFTTSDVAKFVRLLDERVD